MEQGLYTIAIFLKIYSHPETLAQYMFHAILLQVLPVKDFTEFTLICQKQKSLYFLSTISA